MVMGWLALHQAKLRNEPGQARPRLEEQRKWSTWGPRARSRQLVRSRGHVLRSTSSNVRRADVGTWANVESFDPGYSVLDV